MLPQGDPEICRSFLELAISEFTWTKEYQVKEYQVRYNHFDSDPSQWRQITEGYPGVFRAGWTSLSRPDDLKMIQISPAESKGETDEPDP